MKREVNEITKNRITAVVVFLFSIIPLFGQDYKKIVVLDPGHGTMFSRTGTSGEAEVVMELAISLKMLLEKEGIEVILTHKESNRTENLGADFREDNIYRAEMANKVNAVLYFRIHCDAPEGISAVYYPKGHSSKEVEENSLKAGEIILKEILPYMKEMPGRDSEKILTDNDTYVGRNNGGLLEGSKAARVPAVLVETAPLNDRNKEWFKVYENNEKFAEALKKGIMKYLLNN